MVYKVSFSKFLFVVFIIQLCVLTVSKGQEFVFNGNHKKETMSFRLVKNLIIIPVYVNGRGPYNFILDSGVGPLIITDPSLMDSLNVKSFRTTKLSGLGKGDDIEAYVSNDIFAQIGHSYITNIPAAILKKDIFNLSSYMGLHIHGLIGYYFLNSFIVKIKYPSKRLIFSVPNYKVRMKGERIPLEMINNKPYINAIVNSSELGKIKTKLILDIGASHALSLESYNGIPFPLPSLTIPANLGMGFGGLISGKIGRVAGLQIGSFTFKNVLSAFPKYEEAAAKALIKERNGNLGSDILKHFNVIFDYQDFSIYLKPNKFYKKVFDHDMSGMEVYLDDENLNHYRVGRIEPGSPAEYAGILALDEILSINFKPVTQFTLDDIDALFKSGDGKKIALELFRAQKKIYKVLTLKRRI